MPSDRPTVADLGEDALVGRISRLLGPAPRGVLGIGDDAAVVPGGPGPRLLTVDVLVDGVHFRREWALPEEVGRKALAVNLSDAAAMGGRPRYALVSLVLPPQTSVDAVLSFYRGLRRNARVNDVAVLGGNLARGTPLSVTITLVGDFPYGDPVSRSGARPGDRLFVTGQPGLARCGFLLCGRMRALSRGRPGSRAEDAWEAAGAGRVLARRRRVGAGIPGSTAAFRRFLVPDARLEAAAKLARFRPTALLDVSDGLARDLLRLAEAGGVALVVDEARLPATETYRRLCRILGVPPGATALRGGEDYELLFTLPPSRRPFPRVLSGLSVTEIGEVATGSGVLVRDAEGRDRPLRERGFDHFVRS